MTNPGPRWKSKALPTTHGNHAMTKSEKAAFVRKMAAARAARAKKPTKARPQAKATKRHAVRRASRPAAKAASKAVSAVTVTKTKTVSRRRNPSFAGLRAAAGAAFRMPWTGLAGLGADIAALPTALMPAKGDKSDSAIIALGTIGAGFVGTAVAGAIAAPLVASVLPPVQPMVARGINGAVYLASGIVPALCVGNARIRRRLMAGAIGLAVSEVIAPGWSSDLLRNVPVIGGLIPAAPKAAKPKASTKTLKGLEDDLMRLTTDTGTPQVYADLNRPGPLSDITDDIPPGSPVVVDQGQPTPPAYADLSRPGPLSDLGDLGDQLPQVYADLNRPGPLA